MISAILLDGVFSIFHEKKMFSIVQKKLRTFFSLKIKNFMQKCVNIYYFYQILKSFMKIESQNHRNFAKL